MRIPRTNLSVFFGAHMLNAEQYDEGLRLVLIKLLRTLLLEYCTKNIHNCFKIIFYLTILSECSLSLSPELCVFLNPADWLSYCNKCLNTFQSVRTNEHKSTTAVAFCFSFICVRRCSIMRWHGDTISFS